MPSFFSCAPLHHRCVTTALQSPAASSVALSSCSGCAGKPEHSWAAAFAAPACDAMNLRGRPCAINPAL